MSNSRVYKGANGLHADYMTYRQYKKRNPAKYYELGGLGANVGTEKWQLEKEKEQKRKEYFQTLQKMKSSVLVKNY
jgi:hypothetical protein